MRDAAANLQGTHTLRAVLRGAAFAELRIGQRRVNFETGLENLAVVKRVNFISIKRRTEDEEIFVIGLSRGRGVYVRTGSSQNETAGLQPFFDLAGEIAVDIKQRL